MEETNSEAKNDKDEKYVKDKNDEKKENLCTESNDKELTKEHMFENTEENKLLRKFLTQWEKTYHTSKQKKKNEPTENQETSDVKEEKCKVIFGRKVYDFKSKRFTLSKK